MAQTITETRDDSPDREPATPPAPTAPRTRRPVPAVPILGAILVVLAIGLVLRLAGQERGGPAHLDLSIGDGIPATLYVPEDTVDDEFPLQPPRGERPPLVVIGHGYSADQMVMSSMARSLAEAGYATLTFDFRGHGSNTADFRGDLRDDFSAVVDWAETSPNVDGSRIAVLGHSMGAGAALDFATLDDRPVAVIPVSGGWAVNDAVVPSNVLFLVAENDPGFIADRQGDLAGVLADEPANVASAEIGGTDHITILWSGDTIRQIVGFLDPVFGIERAESDSVDLADPRLRTAALYLFVALALVAFVGLVAGRLTEPSPSTASAGGLLLIGGALLVTMPLLAGQGITPLPIGPGQPVAIHLALAGAVLWGTRALVTRGAIGGPVATWIGDGPWLPLRSVAVPGIGAGLAIFLLLTPLAGVFHRLVPTTERLLLWVLVAALALPFFAAFEALVRRGSTWAAVGWGLLGRVLLLVVLFVGLAAGVLPQVLGLVATLLIAQYVLLEVFAATCYGRGRNPAVIAVAESVLVAWIAVTLTPIG